MITTKFYLDTRKTAPGAAAPLKISVTKDRTVSYLNTGIRILPADWDGAAQKARSAAVQQAADMKLGNVISICLDLQRKGRLDGLNAREVRDMIQEEMTPGKNEPDRFLDVLRKFASSRPKQRTTEIYLATAARMLAFDQKAERLTFADITLGWLDRFDSFLAVTSPKKNARNIHFRNIRAVFNYARKRGITHHYPFMNYPIHGEATAKRCLSADKLRRLFTADLPAWQKRYVDFFEVSFLLIGMNTEDLVHATDIVDGRLEYRRAKTGRPYSIKVEPECLEVIDRIRGKDWLLNPLDTYSSTHNWTSKVDRVLKDVAAELGLPKISMYWARHSWLTIGAELEIPKETLSAAAGHSGGTVTDIYINFDRSKIDRANRQVIDYVLHGRKQQTVQDILSRSFEELKKQIAGSAG
jgi:hypothetical protein